MNFQFRHYWYRDGQRMKTMEEPTIIIGIQCYLKLPFQLYIGNARKILGTKEFKEENSAIFMKKVKVPF